MRVLIATWVFPTHGGVFSFLEKVIPHLSGKGHSFDVVAVAPSPESLRPFPHLSPDRIHSVAQLSLPSPLSFPLLGLLLTTLRVVRQRGIDTIFCQDPFYTGLPSLLASVLMKVPLLMGDHGMITNFTRADYWDNFGLRAVHLWRFLSLLVMRRVVKGSSAIYSPGEDVAMAISRLFGEDAASKTQTFPIGIDTEVFRPDEGSREAIRRDLGLGDKKTAVFVGRLHVESGLETLIEAVRLLPEDSRPTCVVVGDGLLRERYELEAEEKAPGRFRFLGYSDRAPEYLRAGDIFVFPKVFAGGCSVALREAMATGLASIATSGVDSHDSIIGTGENGVLTPPGDPASLSTALDRLLSDEELRANLGAQARLKIIKDYDMPGFYRNMEILLPS
jgi:glycosyltransferase involved in cell wall biosynthesis